MMCVSCEHLQLLPEELHRSCFADRQIWLFLCLQLNKLVVERLTEHGLPAVACPVSPGQRL